MIFTDVVNQGFYFCTGLFCGIVCGMYYDVFYAVKTIFNRGRIFLFVTDILFFVLSFFTLFFFLYRVNGFALDWYILAATVFGFTVERLTFKKPVATICLKVYNMLKCIKRYIAKKVKALKRGKNDGKTAVFQN